MIFSNTMDTGDKTPQILALRMALRRLPLCGELTADEYDARWVRRIRLTNRIVALLHEEEGGEGQ